ncbi:MAG: hypothetical protein COV35_01195 [Alphaproteobacteria bacterium CG11_big_fil_rev_8_21_14_0_20_39_49]|nr:MAG: hypothetical protein COV35_01195 [Alphaproteobacteria bacterium CG11_big_fil_rev_8_21_14_0_20_39_49]
MKILLILTILITFSMQSHAMSGSPEIDPECFSSDKIRVEIGGEKFAFPRNIVHSISGDDVINIKGDKHRGNATGSKTCQKVGVDYWKLNNLTLKLNPKPCSESQDCNLKEISITIYQSNPELDGKFRKETSKKELLETCKPDPSATSEWIKKYWWTCNYAFFTDDKYLVFKFTGGKIYPPEDIENTKQLVLDEIYKYQVK